MRFRTDWLTVAVCLSLLGGVHVGCERRGETAVVDSPSTLSASSPQIRSTESTQVRSKNSTLAAAAQEEAGGPTSTAQDPPFLAPISSSGESSAMPPTDSERTRLDRTEAEWRALLTPEQYHVLREKGTERPFTNEYDHHFEPGSYACAACGTLLFEADAKFNSGCGWPAFYAAKAEDRVVLTPDTTHGMVRTEVTCAKCQSHLGHLFDDAPQTPTGQRYCINSVSLKFLPAEPALPAE